MRKGGESRKTGSVAPPAAPAVPPKPTTAPAWVPPTIPGVPPPPPLVTGAPAGFVSAAKAAAAGLDMQRVIDHLAPTEISLEEGEPTHTEEGATDTPGRHVEQLEYTTQRLKEINQRVQQAVNRYENSGPLPADDPDAAFSVVDVDSEFAARSASYDPQAIIEDSKGKLCMTRENVLGSLQRWFEAGQLQEDSLDQQEHEVEKIVRDAPPETLAGSFASNAAVARTKLHDIHSEVVENLQSIVKQLEAREANTAGLSFEEKQRYEAVSKQMSQDIASALERLKDAESKASKLQKALDMKTEEARRLKNQEGVSAEDFEHKLEALQTKAREKEMELTQQLDVASKKLVKTQDHLELKLADSIAQKKREIEEMIEKRNKEAAEAYVAHKEERETMERNFRVMQKTFDQRVESLKAEHELDKSELAASFEQKRNTDGADFADAVLKERRVSALRIQELKKALDEQHKNEMEEQRLELSEKFDTELRTAQDETLQQKMKFEHELAESRLRIEVLEDEVETLRLRTTQGSVQSGDASGAAQVEGVGASDSAPGPGSSAVSGEVMDLRNEIDMMQKELSEEEKAAQVALIEELNKKKLELHEAIVTQMPSIIAEELPAVDSNLKDDRIKQLEAELASQRDELADALARMTELTAQNKVLRNRICALEGRLSKQMMTNEKLRAGEKASMITEDWIELEAKQQLEHTMQLQKENLDLRAKLEQVESQLESVNGLLTAMESKKKELESFVDSLQAQITLLNTVHDPDSCPNDSVAADLTADDGHDHHGKKKKGRACVDLRKEIKTERGVLEKQATDLADRLSFERRKFDEELATQKEAHVAELREQKTRLETQYKVEMASMQERIMSLTASISANLKDSDLVERRIRSMEYELDRFASCVERIWSFARTLVAEDTHSLRAMVPHLLEGWEKQQREEKAAAKPDEFLDNSEKEASRVIAEVLAVCTVPNFPI
eukprot:m51a1_g12222 hypothetical protein (962) ;mRNA; r:36514-41324